MCSSTLHTTDHFYGSITAAEVLIKRFYVSTMNLSKLRLIVQNIRGKQCFTKWFQPKDLELPWNAPNTCSFKTTAHFFCIDVNV